MADPKPWRHKTQRAGRVTFRGREFDVGPTGILSPEPPPELVPFLVSHANYVKGNSGDVADEKRSEAEALMAQSEALDAEAREAEARATRLRAEANDARRQADDAFAKLVDGGAAADDDAKLERLRKAEEANRKAAAERDGEAGTSTKSTPTKKGGGKKSTK